MWRKARQICKFVRLFGMEKLFLLLRAHAFALPILRGYFIRNCIITLYEAGLIRKLVEGGIDITSASNIDRKVNREVLQAILEYLYICRMLEKEGNRYFFSKELVANVENSKGAFMFSEAYSPLIDGLAGLLQGGSESHRIKRNEKKVVEASAETEKWLPYPIVQKMIARYGFNRILDVGSGSCEFLINICRQNSAISCVGIDISREATLVAQNKINQHNLGQRIKVHVADFMNHHSLSFGDWNPDLITFMFLLHEFLGQRGEKELIESLRGLFVRFPRAKIGVCELTLQSSAPLRKNPSLLAEHYFYHALSNQKVLSADEWNDIFRKGGFHVKENIVFDFAGQAFFLLEA